MVYRENYRGGFEFAGLVEIARALRQSQTPAEEIFWQMVRNRRFLGFKFRRQHQIGLYIVDFYCHDQHLVVELDGEIHEIQQKADEMRDAYLRSIGLRVFRITNDFLLNAPEQVLSDLAAMVRR